MKRQRLLRVSYSKTVSHHHMHCGRDSKAGRAMGKLLSGKRLRVCPNRRFLAWGSSRCVN